MKKKFMEKIWQLAPNREIIDYPGLDPVAIRLLANRGISSCEGIDLFLRPEKLTAQCDPFLFKDMQASVELVIKHIKAKSKIFVYGDYDADGVTASALLKEVLTTVNADVEVYIPDRVNEGYGLNAKALDEIASLGAKLLITVDGGIRNKDEVVHAQKLGLDIIITDHHMPPADTDLPPALIINAQLERERYPYKNLAGVGVAFKFAQAIIRSSKLSDEMKEKILLRSLDLVCVGTVADCVNVLGENRYLVSRGLEILNRAPRIGFKELIKAAGNNKKISSWSVAFQLAPRLNAPGRMEHANIAYELLTAKDPVKARELAGRLGNANYDRQRDTEEIMAKVDRQAKKQSKNKILIGVYKLGDDDEQRIWNEGVIGLVAGKIADKYYKPTLVITENDEGYKGSGRSIPEFNIIKAVEECRDLLDKYGGHPSACGFSLKRKNLEAFTEKINSIAQEKLKDIELIPKVMIDCEIELKDVDNELVRDIEKLEPFGQGNDKPKFVSYGVRVADKLSMGADGQHAKIRIQNGGSGIFSAIGFGQSAAWEHIKIGQEIDIVYYLEMNEFNGRSEPQLKIIDIKSH